MQYDCIMFFDKCTRCSYISVAQSMLSIYQWQRKAHKRGRTTTKYRRKKRKATAIILSEAIDTAIFRINYQSKNIHWLLHTSWAFSFCLDFLVPQTCGRPAFFSLLNLFASSSSSFSVRSFSINFMHKMCSGNGERKKMEETEFFSGNEVSERGRMNASRVRMRSALIFSFISLFRSIF